MQSQKFQLSSKTIVWECAVILFAIPFLGAALCVGSLAIGAMGNSEDGMMKFISPIILGLPALAILALSVVLILMPIGRAIFSYLLLSEQGLEYRLWPLHRIRASWEDVDQIKKSSLPFQGDILTLKNAETSGFHISLDFSKGNAGITKTAQVIPLYQIDGWQNGRLENELRKYAPNLFVQRSTS
jgi:hypothetical protein